MHSVVGRTLILTLMMASPAIAQIPSNCDPNSDKQRPFDPAHYVKIFEETSGRRIVLYDPRSVLTSPTLLRADADSKIVLEIDPDCLGSDMALNALFVSAEFSRSDASAGPVKVEVLNYSEVAADPRTQASQAGVALQTAGDVRVVLQGLYNLTKDLVGSIYADECLGPPQSDHLRPAGCDYQFKSGLTVQSAENILRTRLRAFQPRVNAMTDFFSGDKNALVLNEIGTVVFSLDLRSLKATAAMLKSDVAAFLNETDSPQRVRAGEDIRLYLQRIWDDCSRSVRSCRRTRTISRTSGRKCSFLISVTCSRRERLTWRSTRPPMAMRSRLPSRRAAPAAMPTGACPTTFRLASASTTRA